MRLCTDSARLLLCRVLPVLLRMESAWLCRACILSGVQNWPQHALKSYPCMRSVNSDSPGAVCKINVGTKTCAFAKYLFVCSQVCCVLGFFALRNLMQHKPRRNLLRNLVLPGFPWVTPVRNWPGRGLDRHRRSRWLS